MIMRAGAENRDMARALGIASIGSIVCVFAAGIALAALGGRGRAALDGLSRHGRPMLILSFVVVVLGGIGSVKGAASARC